MNSLGVSLHRRNTNTRLHSCAGGCRLSVWMSRRLRHTVLFCNLKIRKMMKNALLMMFLLCLPVLAKAEERDSTVSKRSCLIENDEVLPSFPGGQKAFRVFLDENLRWPEVHAEDCVAGRVICTFFVEADGTCFDFKVLRSLDPSFDEEALRVLRLMPKWIPGSRRGKPVRCKYCVPVRFNSR